MSLEIAKKEWGLPTPIAPYSVPLITAMPHLQDWVATLGGQRGSSRVLPEQGEQPELEPPVERRVQAVPGRSAAVPIPGAERLSFQVVALQRGEVPLAREEPESLGAGPKPDDEPPTGGIGCQ
jgi:hypothetical protein